jgi:hypothetical protein
MHGQREDGPWGEKRDAVGLAARCFLDDILSPARM